MTIPLWVSLKSGGRGKRGTRPNPTTLSTLPSLLSTTLYISTLTTYTLSPSLNVPTRLPSFLPFTLPTLTTTTLPSYTILHNLSTQPPFLLTTIITFNHTSNIPPFKTTTFPTLNTTLYQPYYLPTTLPSRNMVLGKFLR